LDPGHEAKRAALTRVGVVLLIVGVPCLLIGGWVFISSFFIPSSGSFSDFFSDPNDFMNKRHYAFSERWDQSIVGFLALAIGVVTMGIGTNLVFFAHGGKLARYAAGEYVPVVRDAAREMAPVAGEFAREAGRGLREGSGQSGGAPKKKQHMCGAVNDVEDKFCKGCGQSLAAPICAQCGASNDSDARFCQECGENLRA